MMQSIPKKTAILVLAITTAWTTSSCGKLVEKAAEKASEAACEQAQKENNDKQNCDVDISQDGVKIDTGDGEIVAGNGSVKIPDGFPDYLVPDGAEAKFAMDQNGSFNVAFTSNDANAAADSVKQKALAAGCTQPEDEFANATGSEGTLIRLECSTGTAQVIAGGAASGGGLNINFTPKAG